MRTGVISSSWIGWLEETRRADIIAAGAMSPKKWATLLPLLEVDGLKTKK